MGASATAHGIGRFSDGLGLGGSWKGVLRRRFGPRGPVVVQPAADLGGLERGVGEAGFAQLEQRVPRGRPRCGGATRWGPPPAGRPWARRCRRTGRRSRCRPPPRRSRTRSWADCCRPAAPTPPARRRPRPRLGRAGTRARRRARPRAVPPRCPAPRGTGQTPGAPHRDRRPVPYGRVGHRHLGVERTAAHVQGRGRAAQPACDLLRDGADGSVRPTRGSSYGTAAHRRRRATG